MPRTDFIADLYVESNKNISVTKGDSIMFPLKVEPKSLLTVENWAGDSMVSSEQHPDYMILHLITKWLPARGDNRVVFKLTDRFNNTTTADVFIKREKDIITTTINPS